MPRQPKTTTRPNGETANGRAFLGDLRLFNYRARSSLMGITAVGYFRAKHHVNTRRNAVCNVKARILLWKAWNPALRTVDAGGDGSLLNLKELHPYRQNVTIFPDCAISASFPEVAASDRVAATSSFSHPPTSSVTLL